MAQLSLLLVGRGLHPGRALLMHLQSYDTRIFWDARRTNMRKCHKSVGPEIISDIEEAPINLTSTPRSASVGSTRHISFVI